MIIDAGDVFLVKPSEIYAEQIREYRQEFLDTNCSMDGCGPLRKCEDPITYISECEKCTTPETLPEGLVIATQNDSSAVLLQRLPFKIWWTYWLFHKAKRKKKRICNVDVKCSVSVLQRNRP